MENTNNESLKGVKILRSFYEALDEFTYEEKGRMFEAIMEYGLNGVEPNFDDADDARALKAIWKTYLPVVNNSISRAIASAKNGSKGGAPKKSNEATSVASNTQTQNKAPESTISTQDIPEVQVEEKVSKIEEKQVETNSETLIVSYKEKFDKRFAPYIKRNQIYPIQWGDFREITNDKYSKIPGVFNRITNLTSHNFDEFCNVIENLETELAN